MRRLLVALVAIPMILGLAACSGDDDDDPTVGADEQDTESTEAPSDGDAAGVGETVAVTAADFAFDPASIEVAAGEVTFEFTNDDGVLHTFTVDDAGIDISADASSTASGSGTFEPGEYTFRCTIHPAMTGSITAS